MHNCDMTRYLQVQLTDGSQLMIDIKVATELTPEDVLMGLQPLLSGLPSIQGPALPAQASGPLKYRPLTEHLQAVTARSTKLSFEAIEEMLGLALPPSARHRAWWANTDSHSHAKAWLSAGWKTARVDLQAQTVEFHRQA